MKWLATNGSTQHSSDGRYLVMQANSKDHVAYAMLPGQQSIKLGEYPSTEDARACCESHARALLAAR